MKAVALATLLVAAAFTGCFGLFGDDAPASNGGNQGLGVLGNSTLEGLEGRLGGVPRNYTFPGQLKLPPTAAYFNFTVGPEANTGFEDRNDRAGNSFNTQRLTVDVSQYIPKGQPTEIALVAMTFGQPGSSLEFDLYVDVPGTKTDYSGDNGDEFNWKFMNQRMTINTIGVPGQPHEVGVQVANGKVVTPVTITLRAEFSYESDVVTPYHPWAFDVPRNATGIVLESAKAAGQQNVRAKFAVISPSDELVAFVDYNDIAIPTESVYVATQGPGQYIVYVFEMSGGFLRLYADAPVPIREARPLALEVREEMVASGPAPGLIGRDWLRGTQLENGGGRTPAQPGQTATIPVGTFPLRVVPVVTGSGPTAGTQITVTSSKGVVAEYTRFLRVDSDLGSLGYTSEFFNTVFLPENLAKGDLSVSVTNNSPTLSAGYVLTTYKRA